MLRRNSSRSKQRRPLGRSKSTNSIFRSPVSDLVSIEPFAAERDAHIAATLSYHRAHAQQVRHSCDMAPVSRGPRSHASMRMSITNSDSVTTALDLARSSSVMSKHGSPSRDCAVQRQQSVRFVGSSARPRRPLAARANQATSSLPSNAKPDAMHHAASGCRQLRSSEDESQLLCASDEARGPACIDQVPDSGFRLAGDVGFARLRKSRSMFTSSVAPTSEFDFSDSPTDRLKEWLAIPHHTSEDKENEPARGSEGHRLRAPNSMSFLRGRTGNGHSRTSSRADTDLSGQLFVPERLPHHSASRHRLRSHPSMFFRSKHRRCESSAGFPKTLRNSSNNSAALSSAFSGNTVAASKQTGLRVTARKVSRTLKSKFRGLFGRPKGTDDTMAGTLQLPHPSGSDSDSRHRMDEEPEEASMSRVPSHVPSLHAVPSNQQLRSRQGSLESIHVEQSLASDDKSRVTSWTNSSANTVISQNSNADWERQRLSVIRENGMHVSSYGTTRPREPGSMMPPGSTVDSQRVYSALLKKLNETQRKQGEIACAELPETHEFVPPRTSSVDQTGSQQWPPQTIRCVQADDDVFRDKQLGPTPPGVHESPVQGTQRPGSARPVSYRAYPKPTAGDGRGLPPDHKDPMPDLNAPSSLAHISSTFFASPTCHLFRTASPYRRALRETMKEAQEPEHSAHTLDTRYLSTLSALSLPTRRPSTAGSERDIRTTYAESVYSCTTEDANTNQVRSNMLAAKGPFSPPICHGHGDATISVDQTAAYKPAPTHSRDYSSASSVEWKTWLSANVSKLETPSTSMNTDRRGEMPYTLPPFGHVREEAEIESPGDIPKPEAMNTAGLRVATPAKLMADSPYHASNDGGSKRTLEARRKPSMAVDENSPPAAGERVGDARKDRPPPIPWRNDLRTVPSLQSVKAGVGGESERSGSILPRMRSLNTIANASPTTRDDQLLKRRTRARLGVGAASSTKSSPGLTAAVKRQFGKASTGSPRKGLARRAEQDVTTPNRGVEAEGNGTETSRSDWDAQVMGSKRMVDLFLSSRRKQIKGSKTRTESESTSVAFL